MFLRIVADSFGRRPRHKLLTGAALALGMGVATAALSVSLDVGDRLAKEFRGLGANLLVTPQADSLPLEIGGVDYRPVNAGAYLPEADLPKLKTIFWHNNVIGFSPILEVRVSSSTPRWSPASATFVRPAADGDAVLIGTWSNHPVALPEDDFARRDPKMMTPAEFERWSCSPYVSSIAYSINQILPGAEVRVVRRVAEGEGLILTRVRMLLLLVTGAALLAAALAVGASS